MAGIEAKSLGTPDGVRTPAKTKIDVPAGPFVGIEFKSATTYAKS